MKDEHRRWVPDPDWPLGNRWLLLDRSGFYLGRVLRRHGDARVYGASHDGKDSAYASMRDAALAVERGR